MKQFFYISGLPRSGSTLLCNILAQNPNFYISPSTSGCHDVLFGIRNQWDKLVEHQAQGIDYNQLKRVMHSVLNAYHSTDKDIVIDKGRGWLSLIEMIEFITDQKSKIIVPVRDISEILASLEQLWRKSTGMTQWNLESNNYFKFQTVEGRCDMWTSQDQLVGLAYNRIKDALNRGFKDRMFFVEFDELTNHPNKTMENLYSFLDQSFFDHNFTDIKQITKEDDINIHRIPGLHDIRPTIKPIPKRATEVIGYDLVKKYSNTDFWRAYYNNNI